MSRRSIANRGTENASPAQLENLEDRKLMAEVSNGIIGIKVAKVPDVDGTSLNQNRITIAFKNGVRIADLSKFSSFGYANDLLVSANQVKARVGLTITRDPTDARVLQIVTDRLIRKGSRLVILPGGLTDKNGNSIVYDASTEAKTITFTVGQNKPRYTLANRNFKPTDLSYFDRDVFAAAPATPSSTTSPSDTVIRNNLIAFMNKKVSLKVGNKITQAQADQAIAIFDSAAAVGVIPNANLRAALASLVGTAGEPAINSYIGKSNVTRKAYTTVAFGATSTSAPVGETKISGNGRLNLLINPIYAGEPFQVLSATLAHEALHQDASTTSSSGTLPSSQDEEIIANAVETIVYGQQLLVDSSIAGNATGLVVRTNTRLLALLNSGDALFPYGGIKVNPALYSPGNVFVGAKTNPGGFGSTPVKSFEDWIRREYVSRGFSAGGTNTNPTAVAILGNIVGTKGTNLTKFGADTETYLDTRDAIMTDAVYIRMAQALKLTF